MTKYTEAPDNTYDKMICFVICYNNQDYLDECMLYLNQLNIPEGYSVDAITISDAESITAGYQAGMEASPAKYKIYMHQDVMILNRDFLQNCIDIFESNQHIGMIGLVGTLKLPATGVMWDTKERVGAVRSCSLNTVDDYMDLDIDNILSQNILESTNQNINHNNIQYAKVQAIDGLLMMTQYDLPWRTDIIDGWDFYDVSQSLEMARAGYDVVVPRQDKPWTLHDCGFLNFGGYEKGRKAVLSEYGKEIES